MKNKPTCKNRNTTRLISVERAGLAAFEEISSYSVTGRSSYDDVVRYECYWRGSDYSAIVSRAGLIAELVSLPRKYADEGWDGYGALPLSEESFSSAVSFVGKMPLDFPSPRMVVDPDGEICFKWEKSRNNRIELTFSKRNTYYAVVVLNGIRTLIGSTSREEIAMNTERVLGWR